MLGFFASLERILDEKASLREYALAYFFPKAILDSTIASTFFLDLTDSLTASVAST